MLTAAQVRLVLFAAATAATTSTSRCATKAADTTAQASSSHTAEVFCEAVPMLCSDGYETVQRFDGDRCEPWYQVPCFPYGCAADGLTCASSCVHDEDCSGGAVCVPGGTCSVIPPHCDTTCDGDVQIVNVWDQGQCRSDFAVPCFPYTCDGDGRRCTTTCVTVADCADGAECSGDGLCTTRGSTCRDSQTVRENDGSLYNCAPYTCMAGACQTRCLRDLDCAPDATCEVRSQTCVPTG